MASRRSKPRRAHKAWWPQLDLPHLEQRHWDLLGLAMVAFAAFFACIFYLDWAGGEVGEALADALRFLFGAVAYAAPVALLAAGAVLIMRPALPSTHPFKTGALCLAAALGKPRATASSTAPTSSATAVSPASRSTGPRASSSRTPALTSCSCSC